MRPELDTSVLTEQGLDREEKKSGRESDSDSQRAAQTALHNSHYCEPRSRDPFAIGSRDILRVASACFDAIKENMMLGDFQATGESSKTSAWRERQCSNNYDSEYQMSKIRERFGDIQLICKEEPAAETRAGENALGLTCGGLKSSRFFPEHPPWLPTAGSAARLSDASLFYSAGPLPSNAIKIPPPGFQPMEGAPPPARSFSVPAPAAAKAPGHEASVFQPVLQTRLLLSRAVLKMTNIPWEISTSDVLSFFREYSIPSDGVYIPIDRSSGKTKNEVYIEFHYFPELLDALARKHRQIIKSREVFLNRSSWEEVLRAHFPKARLDLNEYITSEEISAIATICRYYKIHFSRKCAERPFEHVMSLMKLLPWPALVESSRDQCFELLQMSVEALMSHISRPNSHIDHALLLRLIDSGMQYAHPLRPAQMAYLGQAREQSRVILKQLQAQAQAQSQMPMPMPMPSPDAMPMPMPIPISSPLASKKLDAGALGTLPSPTREQEMIQSLTSRVHELERLLEAERLTNEAKTNEATF